MYQSELSVAENREQLWQIQADKEITKWYLIIHRISRTAREPWLAPLHPASIKYILDLIHWGTAYWYHWKQTLEFKALTQASASRTMLQPQEPGCGHHCHSHRDGDYTGPASDQSWATCLCSNCQVGNEGAGMKLCLWQCLEWARIRVPTCRNDAQMLRRQTEKQTSATIYPEGLEMWPVITVLTFKHLLCVRHHIKWLTCI